MHLARLAAPTVLASPLVDVIASRPFYTARPLISSFLKNGNKTAIRSMSSTTALGKGYEGNGEKGKKALAIPRPSSR